MKDIDEEYLKKISYITLLNLNEVCGRTMLKLRELGHFSALPNGKINIPLVETLLFNQIKEKMKAEQC